MTTTETPYITFWRAVNAKLAESGEAPAAGGEIDVYARFNKCDLAAADDVALRVSADRWAVNDDGSGERGRAAHAEIIRDRHREFLGSERYP